MKPSDIETACDDIADVIDDSQGQINQGQLARLIQEQVTLYGLTEAAIRQKFQELYECPIEGYVQNALDDHNWLSNP